METRVFTEKQLAYARRANMFEYLLFRGESFDQVSGKTWQHEHHDSLRANTQTGVVTWFSKFDDKRQEKLNSFNNSIEFSMRFYQEPYEKTVQQLLNFQSGREIDYTVENTYKKQGKKPFSIDNWVFQDTKELSEPSRNYLRSRFISDETIDWFEKNDYFSSDTKNNILMKWFEFVPNGHQSPVGADVVGIYRKPVEKRINRKDLTDTKLDRATFKGISNDSKRSGGFFFSNGVTFKEAPILFVHEAPIESLSYVELYKDQLPSDTFFHSMSGLKWESVEERMKEIQEAYPNDKQLTVVLCVNNDEPAREFIADIQEAYSFEDNPTYLLKTHLPKLENGDFNELLELKCTGKLKSREVKENEKRQAEKIRQTLLQNTKQTENKPQVSLS